MLAAVGAIASTGSAYVGARNLLNGQADRARNSIPKIRDAHCRHEAVERVRTLGLLASVGGRP